MSPIEYYIAAKMHKIHKNYISVKECCFKVKTLLRLFAANYSFLSFIFLCLLLALLCPVGSENRTGVKSSLLYLTEAAN